MAMVRGRRILVYRNGCPFFTSRVMLINDRYYRTFACVLEDVTQKVSAQTPVTALFTCAGDRVNDMDELVQGEAYVAVETHQVFVPLDYKSIDRAVKERALAHQGPERLEQPNKSEAKYGVIEIPLIIYIYRNGDVFTPGKKFIFYSRELVKWGTALQRMSDKLKLSTGCLITLWNLKGKFINDIDEVEMWGSYVACGNHDDRFKELPYHLAGTEDSLPKRKLTNKDVKKWQKQQRKLPQTHKVPQSPAPERFKALETRSFETFLVHKQKRHDEQEAKLRHRRSLPTSTPPDVVTERFLPPPGRRKCLLHAVDGCCVCGGGRSASLTTPKQDTDMHGLPLSTVEEAPSSETNTTQTSENIDVDGGEEEVDRKGKRVEDGAEGGSRGEGGSMESLGGVVSDEDGGARIKGEEDGRSADADVGVIRVDSDGGRIVSESVDEENKISQKKSDVTSRSKDKLGNDIDEHKDVGREMGEMGEKDNENDSSKTDKKYYRKKGTKTDNEYDETTGGEGKSTTEDDGTSVEDGSKSIEGGGNVEGRGAGVGDRGVSRSGSSISRSRKGKSGSENSESTSEQEGMNTKEEDSISCVQREDRDVSESEGDTGVGGADRTVEGREVIDSSGREVADNMTVATTEGMSELTSSGLVEEDVSKEVMVTSNVEEYIESVEEGSTSVKFETSSVKVSDDVKSQASSHVSTTDRSETYITPSSQRETEKFKKMKNIKKITGTNRVHPELTAKSKRVNYLSDSKMARKNYYNNIKGEYESHLKKEVDSRIEPCNGRGAKNRPRGITREKEHEMTKTSAKPKERRKSNVLTHIENMSLIGKKKTQVLRCQIFIRVTSTNKGNQSESKSCTESWASSASESLESRHDSGACRPTSNETS